jgi:hypothetical protein
MCAVGQDFFHTDIEEDRSINAKQTIDRICEVIGGERNYGPTPEEKAEMERVVQEEKVMGTWVKVAL